MLLLIGNIYCVGQLHLIYLFSWRNIHHFAPMVHRISGKLSHYSNLKGSTVLDPPHHPPGKTKIAYYRDGKLQNVWQKWKYRCFQIFWMKYKVPFKIPGPFATVSCQNFWGNTFLFLHCWSNLPNHMALFRSPNQGKAYMEIRPSVVLGDRC